MNKIQDTISHYRRAREAAINSEEFDDSHVELFSIMIEDLQAVEKEMKENDRYYFPGSDKSAVTSGFFNFMNQLSNLLPSCEAKKEGVRKLLDAKSSFLKALA